MPEQERGNLIFTRRIGESIVIGENIIITFLGIRADGGVKLGFTAPKEVRIAREEIWEEQ